MGTGVWEALPSQVLRPSRSEFLCLFSRELHWQAEFYMHAHTHQSTGPLIKGNFPQSFQLINHGLSGVCWPLFFKCPVFIHIPFDDILHFHWRIFLSYSHPRDNVSQVSGAGGKWGAGGNWSKPGQSEHSSRDVSSRGMEVSWWDVVKVLVLPVPWMEKAGRKAGVWWITPAPDFSHP